MRNAGRPEVGRHSLLWLFLLKDIREGIGKGFIGALCLPDCLLCPECPLGKWHKNINHITT